MVQAVLAQRHFGQHHTIKVFDLPRSFRSYVLKKAKDYIEPIINEERLIVDLCNFELPVKTKEMLLFVGDNCSSTAISNPKYFRPWGKYFDCYSLTICENNKGEITMSDKTIQEEIQKYREERAKLQRYFTENGMRLFSGLFSDILKKYPNVTSLTWAQYTPYFNDGESCIFGVHNDDIRLNNDDDYNMYVSSYGMDDDVAEHYSFENLSQGQTFCKEIFEVFSQFTDEEMLDLFGDHVEVTVYSDGKIEIDDYHHD